MPAYSVFPKPHSHYTTIGDFLADLFLFSYAMGLTALLPRGHGLQEPMNGA